ncbi:MAG: DUF1501 domain-containing protein [Planctomycetales bacterium]|nr:DUF1501 domain-containing protein [Planctomycetales bacterium]
MIGPAHSQESQRSVRRSFLKLGISPLFGLAGLRSLSAGEPPEQLTTGQRTSVLQSSQGRAQRMILIWLDGAPATIDMWDPKPEAPNSIRGEFAAIRTRVPGIHISEHLPETANVMDRCVLVRSLAHSIPAHGPGSIYMLTGQLPTARGNRPAMGSWIANQLDSRCSIPPYVSLGTSGPFNGTESGFLDSSLNPFRIEKETLPAGVTLGKDTDYSAFERRMRIRNQLDHVFDRLQGDVLVEGLDKFSQRAFDVLRKDTIRKAIDVDNEGDQLLELYGRSPLGKNALRACRLVEAGARYVSIGFSGWDTHANNFTQLRNQQLPPLDKALSGLIVDLETRGLLDSTIVMCCGEFGRTPEVNRAGGRDHWSSAFAALLAGGGFRAGVAYGETDDWGREPISARCLPGDLAATIFSQLGIDPATKARTPSGREMQILETGQRIQAIV